MELKSIKMISEEYGVSARTIRKRIQVDGMECQWIGKTRVLTPNQVEKIIKPRRKKIKKLPSRA